MMSPKPEIHGRPTSRSISEPPTVLRTNGAGISSVKVQFIDAEPTHGQATSITAPATMAKAIVADYSEDTESKSEYLTRADVELALGEELATPGCRERIALCAAARKFPDIAQGSASELPSSALGDIRKGSLQPLSGRYVFVRELLKSPSQGIYHVEVLHGGATMLISRTSRFGSRIVHDPVTIGPDEFERVQLSFLKTYSFLKDPVSAARIADIPDSPSLRASLLARFVSDTGENPFDGFCADTAAVKRPEAARTDNEIDSAQIKATKPRMAARRQS